MKTFRAFCPALAVLVAGSLLSAAAFAQSAYPTRPVKLMVPYAAGGVSDILGRALAQKITEFLGQPMVVENRGGAGGTLGTGLVADAPADGYMVVLSSLTAYAIGPNMMKSVPYDPVKSFTAIGGVALAPNILSVNVDAPYKTLKEMVAYAKANPDKISFGSSGIGSVGHLSGEVLRSVAGIKMVHVPYKSAGVAYPDMISGQISAVFDTLPSAMQHIKSGKARPLALLSDKRSSVLPDVPTFAEAGYPEATLNFWFGVHGPANLPPDVAKKLADALQKTLAAPDFVERLAGLGAVPYPITGEQLTALVRQDMEKLGKVVKEANIKPE